MKFLEEEQTAERFKCRRRRTQDSSAPAPQRAQAQEPAAVLLRQCIRELETRVRFLEEELVSRALQVQAPQRAGQQSASSAAPQTPQAQELEAVPLRQCIRELEARVHFLEEKQDSRALQVEV